MLLKTLLPLAAAALVTVTTAGAATAQIPDSGTGSSATHTVTVARDTEQPTVGSGTPLLSKPADMTTEQWYSLNPFHGMSLAQQAQYYKNGVRMHDMIATLRDMPATTPSGVLIQPVTFAGTKYGHANWRAFRAAVKSNKFYPMTGLSQWYDKDATNDNFLTAKADWLRGVGALVNKAPITVTDPTAYHKSIGYNPNYFSSLEEQTAWLSDKIVNRDPFPAPGREPYNDYQVIAAGLYMYTDGTTPSPNTGDWAESWDRVIPADFDPTNGTSPYQPGN